MNLKCYTRFSDQKRIFTYQEYIELAGKLRTHRKELIIFCDHPSVITAGLQSNPGDLRVESKILREAGIDFVKTSRGGGYTAHEPGQCIIYPHIDLRKRGLRISIFIKHLIETTRRAIQETWELETFYNEDAPGLYTENGRKIVSIGMEIRKDFTSLGAAINLANNLKSFAYINPCGLDDTPMTGITQIGGDPKKRDIFLIRWMNIFNEIIVQ